MSNEFWTKDELEFNKDRLAMKTSKPSSSPTQRKLDDLQITDCQTRPYFERMFLKTVPLMLYGVYRGMATPRKIDDIHIS